LSFLTAEEKGKMHLNVRKICCFK